MEFTLLYLLLTVTMLAAWKGRRGLALGLFGFAALAAVVVLRMHATHPLTLSF